MHYVSMLRDHEFPAKRPFGYQMIYLGPAKNVFSGIPLETAELIMAHNDSLQALNQRQLGTPQHIYGEKNKSRGICSVRAWETHAPCLTR